MLTTAQAAPYQPTPMPDRSPSKKAPSRKAVSPSTRTSARKRVDTTEVVRDRLLQCATVLFATRGFDGTSMADVAAAGSLSKASVLYHFQSKDLLWQECVDQLWRDVDAFMATHGVGTGTLPATAEGFARLLRTYLLTCRHFPAYVSIPALEGQGDTWRARWLAERHLRRHLTATVGYLGTLHTAGVLRGRDSFMTQALIGGGAQLLLGQFALWHATDKHAEETDALIEEYISEVLTLFVVRHA